MLFTDEELFGPIAEQLDFFDEFARGQAVSAGVSYGTEPGIIDLFGAGQYALAGV
ncbi:hypothetical protein [Amycolatopsis sp. H20-H5]|uniref:hypothetical protein n=1 Tax=Amycolatopsis sp. H20-H5 TaxID=3046309 RepID=UPI002DBD26EA|nr:hypothetical protein [Amycolatopsis sp. H20-H5]MEC3977893.1 hypothetical protein [Amycolatopsis sp. H20-H5]